MKIRYAAALLLAGTVLLGCDNKSIPDQKFASVDITGGEWGKEFQLTDHTGKPRTLADFKGKAVVLFFGYTNCPDVCPTTMVKLASAMEKLGKDAERVQVLMVTLDPQRDTQELLAKYVPAFHPSFLGLTGTEQQVDAAAKEFKVIRVLQKPNEDGFYTVDHSGQTYAFDPQGRLRLFFRDAQPAEDIVQDLKTLLKT
ncbi:SCO family protein [Noviherbaspirillum sp. CPCC 100848]|uniref:SCO family protein n=1 Tax=Noviherbaspirillum album TaxID=3080276 RepID=A0ABU6JGC4_9BURK|nr:SCO family protein [Noviherbaspirillum sp. CPCC 100848]MEC4722247.1 SCO family protein [Noviherbaspirillum sp. CPCC 100848]